MNPLPKYLLVLVFLLFTSAANAGSSQPLQICIGDGSPWPPYTYWREGAEEGLPESLTGYATEVVLTALDEAAVAYELNFMPWARLQQELSHESGRCQVTWDASFTEQRDEFSLFTLPIYQTTLGYLYNSRQSQAAPELDKMSVICGVHGFNYEQFADLPRPTFTADTLQQALRMLEVGRCDFLASEIEPMLAGVRLGHYDFSGQLDYRSTGLKKAFRMQVSRFAPQAEQLVATLDQYLTELEASDELHTLRARYYLD